MSISNETLAEIEATVRGGFDDSDRIIQIYLEERYAPGELDANEVTAVVERAFAKLRKEQTGWPAVTDCDRLDLAFAAIEAHGVVALQNAGYTQSDGWEDCSERVAEAEDLDSIIGYCFYHGQDMERAVAGGGLKIAFGPSDPADEQTKGLEVGRIIQEELERAGLKVEWDGTFMARIYLPNILWRRRV